MDRRELDMTGEIVCVAFGKTDTKQNMMLELQSKNHISRQVPYDDSNK